MASKRTNICKNMQQYAQKSEYYKNSKICNENFKVNLRNLLKRYAIKNVEWENPTLLVYYKNINWLSGNS